MHNEGQLQPMTFTELLGLDLFRDADSMFSMGVSYFCLSRFDMEASSQTKGDSALEHRHPRPQTEKRERFLRPPLVIRKLSQQEFTNTAKLKPSNCSNLKMARGVFGKQARKVYADNF